MRAEQLLAKALPSPVLSPLDFRVMNAEFRETVRKGACGFAVIVDMMKMMKAQRHATCAIQRGLKSSGFQLGATLVRLELQRKAWTLKINIQEEQQGRRIRSGYAPAVNILTM